jgi:A/G-specific adenine glycosylase
VRHTNKPVSPTAKQNIRILVVRLLDWFSKSARDLPWRGTRDAYAIWVSEIMLQQTQVKTVIPYWERWMQELPTIEATANVSLAKLHKLWEGLGYYTRVRNLQKAAQQIVGHHNGTFPNSFDEVFALPGIGRYTAGAICSIAFNQPTPILDGNVIRVLTRIFGITTDPREKQTNAKLWHLAEQLVLDATRNTLYSLSCSSLNQSLMELGALICTPRCPSCATCPVKRLCVAFRDNRQAELPNLAKRATATTRRFVAFVAQHRGRFLIRQRPNGVFNAHLWEFPNFEINGESDAATLFKNLFGCKPPQLEKLCTIKHSITRYRITLEAHRVRLKLRPRKLTGDWLTPAKFECLAFTSAHKRIIRRLQD